jgi:hypothetical protein
MMSVSFVEQTCPVVQVFHIALITDVGTGLGSGCHASGLRATSETRCQGKPPPDYADLIKHSLGRDRQLSRRNTVGHETQFGIIGKAALYAGHGPATVRLFTNLWEKSS